MRFLLLLAVVTTVWAEQVSVRVVEKPPSGANRHYAGARGPLAASPLYKLPAGAVRPEGWLRRQLELEAEGFSGRLSEISKYCRFQGNAWVNPKGEGEFGWEELPYWLRGYTALGYAVGDQRIIAESRRWLDAVMASQREDGYFGPRANLQTKEGIDLWPNMVMLYALRTQFEATGDRKILEFMTRYFRFQTTVPLVDFLPASWQRMRGGDNLDSIYWLYQRTGEKFLLDLARMTHIRTADWTEMVPTVHGVNIAQGFREPAQYAQQAHDPRFLEASNRNWERVMSNYGQVPGGMFGADENARSGYTGPRQGSETCAMAEMMYSDESMLALSGDGKWADRAEEVAFNSFPASMTPDLKGLHYLTAPNQAQLDRKSKAPMIENDGDMFSYNPRQYRCCQHNAGFGWPYFAEHLFMATGDEGVAATLYAAGKAAVKAGDGATVTITETTDYPFDDSVSFTMELEKAAKFPLYLRIPAWTATPALTLNGKPLEVPASAKGWLALDGVWQNGDQLRLQLPMRLQGLSWGDSKAVTVIMGPLAYSLKIGERWQPYGADLKWPAFEVLPSTPWNYGLLLKDPIDVQKRGGALPSQPFTPDAAPIVLHLKGKRVADWTLERNGMIGTLPQSPVETPEPVEEIQLIPMGCARLRVSAFPRVH
jgi:DUF1680 family protein